MSDSDDFDERGWIAINDALEPIYGTQEPKHWGTILSYRLGGNDPIHGISAYRSQHVTDHLHYITYGFSELWDKESDIPDISGFGFELTFRLKISADAEPPNWVLSFLQNLGRYVFETGNAFGVGHTMPLNGPICDGMETEIQAITFVRDPELQPILPPNGSVDFLQIVGLTLDEYEASQSWDSEELLQLMSKLDPLLITDTDRASYLNDPEFAEVVRKRTAEEGSSSGFMYSQSAAISIDNQTRVFQIGALWVPSLRTRLLGRLPFGNDLIVDSGEAAIRFEPSKGFSVEHDDGIWRVELPKECWEELTNTLAPKAGTYRFKSMPEFLLVIESTPIKDSEGNVTSVVG
ncbi:MAG: suppressor of fused domain protein [Planctomycetaceae bacterium]